MTNRDVEKKDWIKTQEEPPEKLMSGERYKL